MMELAERNLPRLGEKFRRFVPAEPARIDAAYFVAAVIGQRRNLVEHVETVRPAHEALASQTASTSVSPR